MNTSDSPRQSQLNKAFIKAQLEFETYKKDIKVAFKNVRYSYADLASLFDVCRDVLNKNGIGILQPLAKLPDSELAILTTMLVHESGDCFESSYAFKPKIAEKEFGSQVTYLRRYCLQSLLGIASEDDDGKSAEKDARYPETSGELQQRVEQKKAAKNPQQIFMYFKKQWDISPTDIGQYLKKEPGKFNDDDFGKLKTLAEQLTEGSVSVNEVKGAS